MSSNVHNDNNNGNLFKYDNKSTIILLKWKVKPGFVINQNPFVLFTYRENGVNVNNNENNDNNNNNQNNNQQQTINVEQKYKITKNGIIVKKLLKQNGDTVKFNDNLFEYELCKHPTLMKDLCAVCGVNISKFDTNEQRKIVANTNVSMVHSIPELRVTKEIAEDLGRADEERLLKYRKLVLLVDLDQTIVHSTNQNIPNDLSDEIYHYQLYGTNSPWYHTKFRPYMNEFLDEISKYYELHICTFGARRYAHHIAHLIDPKCKYFPKDRILSRDEFFDPRSKTGNMKSLFPCGDSMVCIIDDRIDVWNYSPNVVQVKPYICFKTDDINAPEKINIGFENIEKVKKIDDNSSDGSKDEINDQNKTKSEEDKDKELKTNMKPESDNNNIEMEEQKELNENDKSDKDDDSKPHETECKDDENEESKKSKELKDEIRKEYENILDDQDDYLLYLKSILIKIHKKFYEEYDERMKYRCEGEEILIPDLKIIIPTVRRAVLHSINIVFSGVIATNTSPESNRYYRLAESLGAIITNDIILNGSPRTTHLIAAKWGTVKVNKCLKYKHIKIVTPDWLIACADRWERVDEELYLLTKDTVYNINEKTDIKKVHYESFRIPADNNRPMPRSSQPSSKSSPSTSTENSATMLELSPLSNFSMNDLDDMGKEVEDACSESSDDDDDDNEIDEKSNYNRMDNDDDDDDDDDNGYDDDEYPKGWNKNNTTNNKANSNNRFKAENEKRGCKRSADEFDQEDNDDDDDNSRMENDLDLSEDSSSSSSSNQSIGSVDEEMAAALEKEFFNSS